MSAPEMVLLEAIVQLRNIQVEVDGIGSGWIATEDDYDGGYEDGRSDPLGWGRTREAAIVDLLNQIEDEA